MRSRSDTISETTMVSILKELRHGFPSRKFILNFSSSLFAIRLQSSPSLTIVTSLKLFSLSMSGLSNFARG